MLHIIPMSPTAAITACFGPARASRHGDRQAAPTEPQSLMYMKVFGS